MHFEVSSAKYQSFCCSPYLFKCKVAARPPQLQGQEEVKGESKFESTYFMIVIMQHWNCNHATPK